NQGELDRVLWPQIAMLLAAPDFPSAASTRSAHNTRKPADAQRLRVGDVGKIFGRAALRPSPSALLPLRHCLVALRPRLGRDLVVAAVAHDERLKVGRRVSVASHFGSHALPPA